MNTPLETIAHCLKESQRLVSAVRSLLELDEFDREEPDADLCNSVVAVSRTALLEAIGFHQTARKIAQDLVVGMEDLKLTPKGGK